MSNVALLDAIPAYVELTIERERELIAAAKEGDQAARDEIVLNKLGLAVQIIRDHFIGALRLCDYDDLMVAATIGLLRSIDRFDLSQNTLLGSYAYWGMRGAIEEFVESSRPTSLSVPHSTMTRRKTNVPAATMIAVERALAVPTSIDAPSFGDSEDTLQDRIAGTAPDPEDEAIAHEQSAWLAGRIHLLTGEQRRVIEHRFGLSGPEMTLQEIADRFGGVHRDLIRQIEETALEVLRTGVPKVRVRVADAARAATALEAERALPVDLNRRRNHRPRNDYAAMRFAVA